VKLSKFHRTLIRKLPAFRPLPAPHFTPTFHLRPSLSPSASALHPLVASAIGMTTAIAIGITTAAAIAAIGPCNPLPYLFT
jgi:hypothetical protein